MVDNPASEDHVSWIQAQFSSAELVRSIHLNVAIAEVVEHEGGGPPAAGSGGSNARNILALVENGEAHSFALFLLLTADPNPKQNSDLSVVWSLPVDEHFCCDTEFIPNEKDKLYFIVRHRRVKVHFVVAVGTESCIFASELIRACEVSRSQLERNHAWLAQYLSNPRIRRTPHTRMAENSSDFYTDSDSSTLSSNRESRLKYELTLRESEFTDEKIFSIFVATWNVNGQLPSVPLQQWLASDEDPPDIYAIGLQEVDMSKEAFIFSDSPREHLWHEAVLKGLHSGAKYRLVASERLVGILLFVFIKYTHFTHLKTIEIYSVGTGILGKIGNKGGVGVRFELHNKWLCFINCHLAAFAEEVERRNQDYGDINARMSFRKPPHAIKDHDYIFWFGDLNYRINEMNSAEVKKHIQRGELIPLMIRDQLNIEKDRSKVLKDFIEPPITFVPTYKYDLNSDMFDSSEKARAPAWTDRIFYKSRSTGTNWRCPIVQICYRSIPQLRISDHKPVNALFDAPIGVIDKEKYRRVHELLLKEQDKLENEYLPQVTVDQTEVSFGTIKFREQKVREIIIANTGLVPAKFEFINKLNDKTYCKDWLAIKPFSGCINPGEKCDIQLEVNLKLPNSRLEEILILHLDNGKDMFITVSAECQRTSFLTSMSALVRCPLPVLTLEPQQIVQAETLKSPVLYSIPRELWLLVDNLVRHGRKSMDLFSRATLREDIIKIRDWLDYGSLEPIPGSVYASAEALILFLSYTPGALFSDDIYEKCISATNFEISRKIVLQMPQINRNVFIYICMFLQEMLKYADLNGLDAKQLATTFGNILIRDPDGVISSGKASQGKMNFVYYFLMNDLSNIVTVQ